jgi:hypothetical protein
VVAKPGETAEVSARLEPAAVGESAPAAAAPPAAAPPDTTTSTEPAAEREEPPARRASPVGPLLLAGGGVIAGAVGLVVRLQAQSSYDDASAHCSPAGCPNQAWVDQGNSARASMLVGTVVFGAGVAAVVGAGVWWLTATPTRDGVSATVTARF